MTLFLHKGSVGNVAFYNEIIPYDNVRINSGMVIIRVQRNIIIPRYLFIYLNTYYWQNEMLSMVTGSAQPQLPIKDINKVRVYIPPIEEQIGLLIILVHWMTR